MYVSFFNISKDFHAKIFWSLCLYKESFTACVYRYIIDVLYYLVLVKKSRLFCVICPNLITNFVKKIERFSGYYLLRDNPFYCTQKNIEPPFL